MTIYLYAKQHRVTGLRYFGKTKKDPYTYTGSGTYWLRHLKTHGKNIDTTWVQAYEDDVLVKEEAVFFSKIYNIVESDEWANLTIETGLDGRHDQSGSKNPNWGKKHSDAVKEKQSKLMAGHKQSPATIAKRVAKNKGQVRSNQSEYMKQRWAERKLNNIIGRIGCKEKSNA